MKSWDYIQARRGTTLEGFLKGVITVTEALELFSARGILPPPIEDIESLLGPPPPPPRCPAGHSIGDATINDSTIVEPSVQKEYDELVIIETAQEVIDG